MEEIKKNIEMEINSDIDIDKSVRDTDGDREIEIDVAAEVDRIVDRRVEQDDLHENTKKILTNTVQKMKDAMIIQVVDLINVVRKKLKEKTQAVNQVLQCRIHIESTTEASLLILVGVNVAAELLEEKRSNHENNK